MDVGAADRGHEAVIADFRARQTALVSRMGHKGMKAVFIYV